MREKWGQDSFKLQLQHFPNLIHGVNQWRILRGRCFIYPESGERLAPWPTGNPPLFYLFSLFSNSRELANSIIKDQWEEGGDSHDLIQHSACTVARLLWIFASGWCNNFSTFPYSLILTNKRICLQNVCMCRVGDQTYSLCFPLNT